MLRFRSDRTVPPGGYCYLVPETDVHLEHVNRGDLLSMIRKHYGDNNLKMPANIWDLVQDYICRNVPSGFCMGDDDGKPRRKIVTLQQVRELCVTAARRTKQRVDPGTALARARHCCNCAKNDRNLCTSCTGINEWAARYAGQHRLQGVGDWIGLCGVDALALTLKVWLTDLEPGEHPKDCWINKGIVP